MPSASVSTATVVNPGFFNNWRKANLRSFVTQRLHRIDLGRLARRDIAGQQGHCGEQYCHAHKGSGIGWLHLEKIMSFFPTGFSFGKNRSAIA